MQLPYYRSDVHIDKFDSEDVTVEEFDTKSIEI